MDDEKTLKNIDKIQLTAEQEKLFVQATKIGIIKQLHKNGILTNEQFNLLIKIQVVIG